MATTILIHITDLHFPHKRSESTVDDKAGILEEADYERHSHERLFLNKLSYLKQNNSENSFVLVVTGDLTTRARRDGFVLAQRFLEQCCKKLGISESDVVICPGNHDLSKSSVKKISCKEFGNHFSEYCNPFGKKKDYFYRNVGIIPIDSMDYAKEKKRSFWDRPLRNIMNRDSLVDAPKIKDAEAIRIENFGSSAHEDVLRIAAFHHHIVPVFGIETKPFDMFLNAGTYISEFNKLGYTIILHGHKHDRSIRFIQDLDSQIAIGCFVIGGNSFAKSNGAYNQITIDNDNLENIHLQSFQISNGNYLQVGRSLNLAPKNVNDQNIVSVSVDERIEL